MQYIDYDIFKNIEAYALKHFESSKQLYTARKQNMKKAFNDILRGKIAEYNCYYQLQSKGYILDKPDLNIYTHTKCYDADLIILGKGDKIYEQPKHIHVKSISRDSYEKYGASFLIEANDPVVLNPEPDHYFSVLLEESFLIYNFYMWLPCTEVEYGDPVMNLPTKKAVYL
jgi:hypothetical protein